jgi:cellulose synthase/poly-beta-1,6-N-acetylglucosamine synthase-like glycosyltransferase
VAYAELHAAESGVSADHVLCARGLIDEETYVVALADRLGMAFEPLTGRTRDDCPLSNDEMFSAAVAGIIRIKIDGDEFLVAAPRLIDTRQLVTSAVGSSDLRKRMRLTTVSRLNAFVACHNAAEIEQRAVHDLRSNRPDLSASTLALQEPGLILLAAACAVAPITFYAPSIVLMTLEATLFLVFLAWSILRLLGLATNPPRRHKPRALANDRLPVYSVVVALYREAASVKELIGALRAIDYPAEKLDIKFILEPNDHETRKVVAGLGPPFEVIIAPRLGPRTKPKALNIALPFVRGKFVVVYDAEDRPDPDQLRVALETFVFDDGRLACVQAQLTIDNSGDSWLSRLFTAEYAGLFDVFLPGLAAWQLPLPLGGSSNHFRTEALFRVGAWDPYNVTEDADLGMRLARLGYRTDVISSSTYEEAPSRFHPWLRQRTRWFKGWMQTWLVHTRSPRYLARDLGWRGFAAFQLIVGGTVLSALVHSIFVAALVFECVYGRVAASIPTMNFHIAWLVLGYVVSAAIAFVGLRRRGLLGCTWALLLIPLYWLMLSIAAWRALYQLIRDPHGWEKTEHGLAKTSRLAGRQTAVANHRYRFKSAAASSGRRFRLNGVTNRPDLSIR